MATNATFKHMKKVMKERAWNGKSVEHKDSTFWLDNGIYRRLREEDWRQIDMGKAKL